MKNSFSINLYCSKSLHTFFKKQNDNNKIHLE